MERTLLGSLPANSTLNLTELLKMNETEIKKIIEKYGVPVNKSVTLPPLRKTICNCSVCGKDKFCEAYNGCHSSIKYERRTGKIVEQWHSCLPGDSTNHDDWNAAGQCGVAHTQHIREGPPIDFTIGHTKPIFNYCLTSRCCYGDHCNTEYPPVHPNCITQPKPTPLSNGSTPNIAVHIAAPISALIFLIFVVLGIFKLWKRKSTRYSKNPEEGRGLTTLTAIPLGDDSLRKLNVVDDTCMSSGSGLPCLVQSTVARQITLCDLIGKGRYGEVWRGSWQGEHVAVKIFNSRDEESWKRETEIYNTVLLRHDNILGYIGSDIATRNGVTCMWLITHYHANGALYDYLNLRTLSTHEMITLAYSAVSGLAHLHTEIAGLQGKPAIAHRDVKSKNILVKRNGHCCISDLGLAVLHTKTNNKLDICHNYRVGTKRYMAPELLNESMQKTNFSSFRQVDMYCFSLVLWEILRRTVINGSVEEYQPPYYDTLPPDPSFDYVKKVVCDDTNRPLIPKSWYSQPELAAVAKLMSECWSSTPNARLTSLRIKKTLGQILHQLEDAKRQSAEESATHNATVSYSENDSLIGTTYNSSQNS